SVYEVCARVGDLLLAQPPLLQRAVWRVVVPPRGRGDGVALPRIGMVLRDLLLHEIQASPSRIELAVRQHALRAGDPVDEIAHRRSLLRVQHAGSLRSLAA